MKPSLSSEINSFSIHVHCSHYLSVFFWPLLCSGNIFFDLNGAFLNLVFRIFLLLILCSGAGKKVGVLSLLTVAFVLTIVATQFQPLVLLSSEFSLEYCTFLLVGQQIFLLDLKWEISCLHFCLKTFRICLKLFQLYLQPYLLKIQGKWLFYFWFCWRFYITLYFFFRLSFWHFVLIFVGLILVYFFVLTLTAGINLLGI